MVNVKAYFENCYGIRNFNENFDFEKCNTFIIYAANGIMKSSFAKTFKDFSTDIETKDRIFSERKSVRAISYSNGAELEKDFVFVIEPYSKTFKSQKLSKLLVNSELKERYDNIYAALNEQKEILSKELSKISGVKKDLEREMISAIGYEGDSFFESLVHVKDEINTFDKHYLLEISHSLIFNDKVMRVLADVEFRRDIMQYIATYEELLERSFFFKKGVFNHNNAEEIARTLEANGFFKAEHSVCINAGGEKVEISSFNSLKESIEKEKEILLNNNDLVKAFELLDRKLRANEDTRKFRELLASNVYIIPLLFDLKQFKKDLWIAYLSKCSHLYLLIIESYESSFKEIQAIISRAKEEKTAWQDVVEIFNKRFNVPFKVKITNIDDAILNKSVPNIEFEYHDKVEDFSTSVKEDILCEVLSNGELRAFYILNIIFEVEARKKDQIKTLFIIDDIADSFDYKNKYAIIEYLLDMSNIDYFYMIILTHNFDFYRTTSSRLNLFWSNRLYALKNDTCVKLVRDKYPENPFKTWKKNFRNNMCMLIALIPFVRNIAEYSGNKAIFQELTAMLHVVDTTYSIKLKDLIENIQNILSLPGVDLDIAYDATVIETVYSCANSILESDFDEIDLENKIVLSIAIRLKAEEFLLNTIDDKNFIESIKSSQTGKLIRCYKRKFPDRISNIRILDEVNLMTPENIHINSFMYEPILDLGSEHLKSLYSKVKNELL